MGDHHDSGSVGCEVLLVRHGRTAWNVGGENQGKRQSHRQVPLDAVGQAMAAALAQSPAVEGVTAIYTSDLKRAVETAEPVAQRLGLPLRYDVRLRESRGKPAESHEYEELAFHVETETRDDVQRRGVQCLEEIAARHQGQRVLAMSHGALIRHFLEAVCPAELEALRAADNGQRFNTNTAIWHLHWTAPGCWTPLRLRDCDHLEGVELEVIGADVG